MPETYENATRNSPTVTHINKLDKVRKLFEGGHRPLAQGATFAALIHTSPSAPKITRGPLIGPQSRLTRFLVGDTARRLKRDVFYSTTSHPTTTLRTQATVGTAAKNE